MFRVTHLNQVNVSIKGNAESPLGENASDLDDDFEDDDDDELYSDIDEEATQSKGPNCQVMTKS